MEEWFAACDSPEHLRALVHKLLADRKQFRVSPETLAVYTPADPDEPLYLELALAETANEEVHFDFDSEEAKGRLTVGPGSYGPTLALDGVMWGYVDMFHASPCWTDDPPAAALPPQLLLFSPHNDQEQWLKVFVEADNRMTVVVHKEAGDRGSYHPRAIHSDHSDRIYTAPWDPAS